MAYRRERSFPKGYRREYRGRVTISEIEEEEERIAQDIEIERRLDELRAIYVEWVMGDGKLEVFLSAMMENGLCAKLSPFK